MLEGCGPNRRLDASASYKNSVFLLDMAGHLTTRRGPDVVHPWIIHLSVITNTA